MKSRSLGFLWDEVEGRLNYDQHPISFVLLGTGRIWASKQERKNGMVKKKTPHAGLCKRQATIQLVCTDGSFVDDPPPITVCFRGTGRRISQDERDAYHPGVKVIWQRKAWFDQTTQLKWFGSVMTPWLKRHFVDPSSGELMETLGTCDSLAASKCDAFVNVANEVRHRVYHGPKNFTEHWQACDRGPGQLVKTYAKVEQDTWLLRKKNWQLWSKNKLTASQRRILMTKWIGKAYEKLIRDKSSSIQKAMVAGGTMTTLTGQGDDQIHYPGLPDFRPPPPGSPLPQAAADFVRDMVSAWARPAPVPDAAMAEVEAVVSDSDSDSSSSTSSSSSSSTQGSSEIAPSVADGDYDPPDEDVETAPAALNVEDEDAGAPPPLRSPVSEMEDNDVGSVPCVALERQAQMIELLSFEESSGNSWGGHMHPYNPVQGPYDMFRV